MKHTLTSAMQAAAERHTLLLHRIVNAEEAPCPIGRLEELYLLQRADLLGIPTQDAAVPLHKRHLFDCPWSKLTPQDRIFLANVYIASPDCTGLE